LCFIVSGRTVEGGRTPRRYPGKELETMPTQQTLLAFTLVSAAIVAVPGPSNFFLLAHGIGHGRRSALAAVTGIEVASAIRVVLTAAGLSAVLASSAAALGVIRWAGVAYLTYLGVRAWRLSSSGQPAIGQEPPMPLARSARKGLIVGLGNPKMVIFFLAFLPQFVHPAQGPQALQILILGALFWAIGAIWDLTFACASGTIGSWLRRRPRLHAAQPRAEGIAYLGLAGWMAATGARS
jgi:threonine/homoserine/homoserine lactone efflux protein